MRKAFFLIMTLLLWTGAAAAQEMAAGEPLEADIRVGGLFVQPEKNAAMAAKYDYLHSSGVGAANIEWDLLPHRFKLDSYYLNQKDYFADMDYSWKDVIVFNFLLRGAFHNLHHLNIGEDDPLTAHPSFIDRDPSALYGVGTSITRTFLRFKAPDFPLHVYAEARQIDREGTVQQRFLDINNAFPPDKVSDSRVLDTHGTEVTVGANSHLGPVELDYNHTQRKVEEKGDKVLSDPYLIGTNEFSHNKIPELSASADSVKLHTSFTGRLVAAATYVNGDKKNKDSETRADYSMAAGDVTWIPVNDLAVFVKYRHYEQDLDNPETVITTIAAGPTIYNVRDSLNTQRDVITATARYRVTDRLAVKAEGNIEAFEREMGPRGVDIATPPANIAASWNLPTETTKSTAKVGAAYRISKRLLARADYSHLFVDNPAYETDPDKADYLKGTVTWTPARTVNVMVGYNGAREKRDVLDAPLAGGEREASRDQALGSVTFLLGKRSSASASYGYFKTKVEQGITYRDPADESHLERDVPYSDKAQTGSVVLTHSPQDGVNIALEAKRTYAKGSWRNSGSVANTGGIADLSDLEVVEGEYTAELDVQYTRELGYELRYRLLETDDKLDNEMDGAVKTLLAVVSMKW